MENDTYEQDELKKRARRRLIGAITLALLAVLFLPMVMDDQPPPYLNKDLKVTTQKTGQKSEMQTSQSQVKDEGSYTTRDDKPEAEAITRESKNNQKAREDQERRRAENILSGRAEKKVKTAASGEWVVRLGAFSKIDNALQIKQRVKKLSLPVFIEEFKNSKARYRVRSGPYTNSKFATAALEKLKYTGGISEATLAKR